MTKHPAHQALIDMSEHAKELHKLWQRSRAAVWVSAGGFLAMNLKWVLAVLLVYGSPEKRPENLAALYSIRFDIAVLGCFVMATLLILSLVFRGYLAQQMRVQAMKAKTLISGIDYLMENITPDPTLDDLRKPKTQEKKEHEERMERVARILFSAGMPDNEKD